MKKTIPSYCWIILIFLSQFSNAQSYRFQTYTEQQGLESRYINTIEQSLDGKLVIGTGEGLFTYDGFRFQAFHAIDSLADELIETSFQDKSGKIYLGHGNGNVSIYFKGKISKIDLSKYLSSKISNIFQDAQDNIWFISQNSGLICKKTDGTIVHLKNGLEDYTILCASLDNNNTLWLGTDLGLIHLPLSTDKIGDITIVEELPLTSIIDLYLTSQTLFIATEDAGLFVKEVQNSIYRTITLLGSEITELQIKSIRVDSQKHLWLSCNQLGLVELFDLIGTNYQAMQIYNESGTDAAENIRTSFLDREGNLWIGTIGKGLYKLEEDYLSTYNTQNNNAASSLFSKNDTLWSGYFGKVTLSVIHPGFIIKTYDATNGLPEEKITALLVDENSNLWIGTENSGLFFIEKNASKAKKIYLASEFAQARINDIETDGNIVYVATNYGIFYLKNLKVYYHATIETGLAGNVIKSLFKDSQSRIWISTSTTAIPYLLNGEIKYFQSPFSELQLTIHCMTEDQQNRIWAGTDGMGVICITDPSKIIYNKLEGLGSDYCYSIFCDRSNQIWVAHRAALSCIKISDGSIHQFQPDPVINRTFEDNTAVGCFSSNIIFGTSTGILRYDPQKDLKNTFEPILSFEKILINETPIEENTEVELSYGDHKLELYFRGISLKNPKGVTYQFYLEGYDTNWSLPTSENYARYNHLAPGTYQFKVKCFNADGVGGSTILTFTIHIKKPFWQQWWFILSSVLLVVTLVRFIILRREKILRENQEKLQSALDERTKEVVEQKTLLEIKNKDITDSILYAKNIQNAMLPPKGILNKYFNDAFVYYKPRDIVSGDFYWSEKFGTKVLVALADCTGHGVPGAFMSLIGSTLIKDVAKMKEVNTPVELLTFLDMEIQHILNKTAMEDGIRDGMDISIIDFDTETNVLRFAGANRPIFVYHQGTLNEVKGDRRSIGESDRKTEMTFSMREIQLQKGDIIYMFSDGVTDQFGGPEGKKLKRKGFQQFISKHVDLSMREQRNQLRNFLSEWKKDTEQLDDIIIIAFKI